MCRLYRETKETVQHLLAGCEKLAGTEYVRRHNNALKVSAVWWAVKKDYYLKEQNGMECDGRKGK